MRLSEFLNLLRKEIGKAETVEDIEQIMIDDLEIDNVEISVGVGVEKDEDGENIITVMKKDDKNAIGKLKIEMSEWEPDDYDDDEFDELEDELELDPSDERFLDFLNNIGSDEKKEEK